MSLDLLAEFGPSNDENQGSSVSRQSAAPPQAQATAFSFFDDLATLNARGNVQASTALNIGGSIGALDQSGSAAYPTQPAANSDRDDDWGEFGEFEEAPPHQPASTGASTGAWNTFQDVKKPPQPVQDQVPKRGQVQRLDTEDFFNSRLLSKAASQHVELETRSHDEPKQKQIPRPRDSNVLFDATEEFEDHDDFGDFEAAEPSKPKPVQAPSTNLLDIADDLHGLTLGAPQPTIPLASKPPPASNSSKAAHSKSSASNSEKPRIQTPAKPPPRAPKPEPQTTPKLARDDDDEAWDDFTESAPAAPSHDEPSPADPLPSLSTLTPPSPPPDALPPTNIPPPSLLLSLFPPIFATAQTQLFHPLAAQPYPLRNRILSDPATVQFLRGYLALATVAARVIAGRKLRWRRDARLAQGMRIGPAAGASGGRGGGGGGMKLVGVDRAEAVKEEREVGEVVRAWGEQVGRVRAAVVGVKAAGGAAAIGEVPEIRETMGVRTAGEVEGGVPAPRPCALCGLRREERVVKVDGVVEDSFGEWWVERMSMHRTCRNFWEEHKDKLRQR